ncbi:tape measure protein [Moellerella wisconsensis]|uniref:tape measure protein n=1 Tax=Moellerella wisconsensis TaxID=158849 RepID=UPI003075F534
MADSLGFRLSLDDKDFEIKITNAGRLLGRLPAHANKANAGIKRLEGGFSGFSKTLSETITTIGMASFAIGTMKSALFDWQKSILDSAGKLERLQVMLQGLATSSDRAKESISDFNYIVNKAKSAPFSIDAISDSFVKLKSAGIDPTNGSLNSMVDAVARFGGDSELLKRATIAIQQMAGKGVVSMEELRQQLGEAVPTAMQAMATSMNLSMSELTKAVSSGKVEATTAVTGMLNIMEMSYKGSAKRMMNTYTGIVSQIQTNMALLAKEIGDAGYMDAVKGALKDVNSLLTSDAASYYGKQFGDMAKTVIDGARGMFTWILNNQSTLTSLLKIILAIAGAKIFLSFFKSVTGAITSFNGAIARAVSGGGAGLVGFGQGITNVASRSQRMGGSLNVATVAIGQMTHAWRGLNMAMKANLIVAAITTVIEIVASLAWWFGRVEEKIKDASGAARNMPSMVTDEQLALLKKNLHEQEKEVDASNKRVESAKNYRDQIYARKSHWERVDPSKLKTADDSYKKQLEDNKKVLEKHSDDKNLIEVSEMARSKEAMRKKLDLIMEANQKESDVRKADYEAKKKEIETNRDKELLANKGNTEKQEAVRKESADKLREIYENEAEADRVGLEKVRKEYDKQQKEISDKIVKRTAELGDAMAEKNDISLNKLISQKAQIGIHYTDIANQINTLAQAVANGRDLMFKGWKGQDGSFNDGGDDTFEKGVDVIRRKNQLLALGDKIDNGESIATIDGRISKGKAEAKASMEIVEMMKKRGLAVDNLKEAYDKLSVSERAKVDGALADARIQDEADRKKAKSMESKKGESAAEKAKRQAEKLAAEHVKVIEQAEQMAEKVGFGSQEVVKYDQSIKDLTDSLKKLSESKPQAGVLSQEQIDEAKKQLEEIRDTSEDYRKSLAKDSSDQLISKWAGFSKTVVGNMTTSVEEQRVEFNKSYDEADRYFKKIIERSKDNKEVKEHLENEYAKFQAGKQEALVRMTETATAKMAYDYQNLGNLIDENIKGVFDNLEDKLMNFISTGEFSIKEFGDFIFTELQRTFVRSMVVSPIINSLGLGAGGDTGASLVKSMGTAMSGIFGSGDDSGKDPNAKATDALGKAAEDTTGALQNMQSQGIFATIAAYAKQLWATITGTAATETKATAEITATTTIGTFTGSVIGATTALSAFIASLGTQSAASGLQGIIGIGAAVGGAVAGSASGAGGAAAAGAGSNGFATGSFAANIPAFANGGIMSALGEVPLKTYAKGGIASSPQLALFGEGKYNEAYVPLPDGRSIPVNMNVNGGESSGEGGVVISISVINQDGESKDSSSMSQDKLWNGAAEKIKAIVVDTITDQKRPGGMLSE